MVNPVPNNAPVASESRSVQELSVPLFQARGWLKFLGILSIIGGVGQALSIVGILVAWLPIWMGVMMYQAGSNIGNAGQFGDKGSNIGNAGQFGDKFAFLRSMSNLKTLFTIMGVLSLLSIILALIMICLAVVLPLIGISVLPWNDIYNSIYNSINTFNSIY
jgi:hypothetical protein